MKPLLPLGGANECPACGHVHGQPTTWPVCPVHGHRLAERQPTDDGWTYVCPAWKCTHTHTQHERATMTSTEAALAIRDGQDFWDAKQLAALAQLGIEGAPNADLAVFMHRCQVTGLDPFGRQITMIKRRERVGQGEWRDKWTIQTEIDGYRVIAHRAARRDGVTLSYGPTKWYDDDGNEYPVWVRTVPPAAASVTVYRDNRPFPGVARFLSFAAMTREGQPMANWATMPDHMIAKCAEAQALRKAFPNDLDGIQTADETAHTSYRPPRVSVAVEPAPPPRQDPPVIRAAIRAQFDRLDIVDDGERDNIVCRLAGRDPADGASVLGETELLNVLSKLESCTDTGDLHAPADAS